MCADSDSRVASAMNAPKLLAPVGSETPKLFNPTCKIFGKLPVLCWKVHPS